jgi:hypothetical protein
MSLIKSKGGNRQPLHVSFREGRTNMFGTLKDNAWAVLLAAGGLLSLGAAAARADDSRAGERRPDHRSGRSARRSELRKHERSPSSSRESGRGRVHAARGPHGSKERTVARASQGRTSERRHGGRWEHGQVHHVRKASHHPISMHREEGRRGWRGRGPDHASHGRTSQSGGSRHHGRREHDSRSHDRSEGHQRSDDRSRSHRRS